MQDVPPAGVPEPAFPDPTLPTPEVPNHAPYASPAAGDWAQVTPPSEFHPPTAPPPARWPGQPAWPGQTQQPAWPGQAQQPAWPGQAQQYPGPGQRQPGAQQRRRNKGGIATGAAGGAGVMFKLLAGAKALRLLALKFKVLLSMFVSVAAYALFWGWKFAAGFVLLLLIHELGHVVVLRTQGIKASAPMFIPFLGAFVTMKSQPRSVAQEAVSALAGPVAGLAASGVVLGIGESTGSAFLRALAYTGFLLNLFNLLPALPLDGGRVAGALHPAVWFAGIAGAVVLLFYIRSPILLFVLIIGGIEAVRRWRAFRTGRDRGYHAVPPRTRWAIAGGYATCAVLCLAGMVTAFAPMSL